MIRALALLLVLTVPAFGQDDKARDWERLKELATQTELLQACGIIVSLAADKSQMADAVWAGYEKRATALMHGLDAHVLKYSDQRGSRESLPTFRFRVWSQAISMGSHNMLRKPMPDAAQCLEIAK